MNYSLNYCTFFPFLDKNIHLRRKNWKRKKSK